MNDNPEWVASDLISLVRTDDEGGSPLEKLWQRCPGFFQSLPLGGLTDDQIQAARAYLYSGQTWLDNAKAIFPQVQGTDQGADLAAAIVRVQSHVEYLKRLGYTPTLDGVTGSLADLARKVHDWTPSSTTLALGGVAVLVIALLVVLVILK